MLKLGDYNTLRIKKRTDFGLYLDGGDEGNILLPNRYVPKGYVIGQEIEVFLYLDQDERIVATTEHPIAKVGEFAWMECAWTNEYGAFLNWGLMKDLFCPFREQKVRMQRGKRYLVYCYIDDKTYRIVCSSKIEKFQKAISEKDGNSKPSTLKPQPDRKVLIGDFSTRLFEHLKLSEKGFTPYHDKSPAEEIYAMFGVSKKVFKQAVGDLLKRELIQIKSNGIELTIKGKATGIEE